MNDYTILIYAQHTPSAGRWASALEEDADIDWDDYLVYEGTREQILTHADAADERAAQSGAGNDVYWRRVARSLREAVECYNNSNIHVCEVCGGEFHALGCQNDDLVDGDGDVVGYRLPIHEDDPLHEGAENGTTCWVCGHEYMGHTFGICVQCGDVLAWANVEHGDLLAANDGVVGRRTPDGPICTACDDEE